MRYSISSAGSQRAFTIATLLISLTILAVFALYLLPLVSHYRSQQAASICIANLRRLGQSTLMYANDFDETMPLSTSNINGRWLTNNYHMSPPNWSSSSHPAVSGSRFIWPNSCLEYGITDADLTCPNHQAFRVPLARFTYDTPLARPKGVSYSMNGLLNAYKMADITNKALVPMVWEGRGRAYPMGGVLQNPLLSCIDGTQPCTFNTSCNGSSNGGTGSAFGLDASVWTHGKQNNWLFVDGHVEERKMGAVLSPENTDRSLDL